jgi:class 3 adenylate cyclase
MLTNQVFRDIYGTDTIDVEQRLKITSLTFLFTDLKGSTELYERVGDLVAFDLVRAHFRVLNEIVAAEAGAVVKTIGDAVMATFPTPNRAVAAALRMREAMRDLNDGRSREDLLLKIGIHEGPCLAVVLNDRQDYFGSTVNIAARVQALADSRAILTTRSVVADPQASALLETSGLKPVSQRRALRHRRRSRRLRDPVTGRNKALFGSGRLHSQWGQRMPRAGAGMSSKRLRACGDGTWNDADSAGEFYKSRAYGTDTTACRWPR